MSGLGLNSRRSPFRQRVRCALREHRLQEVPAGSVVGGLRQYGGVLRHGEENARRQMCGVAILALLLALADDEMMKLVNAAGLPVRVAVFGVCRPFAFGVARAC